MSPCGMLVEQVQTPYEGGNQSPGRKVSAGSWSAHDCCTGTLPLVGVYLSFPVAH